MLEELKRARTSVGLSRQALGERIGVDSQTIKRLEGGIGSVTTMVAVMKALDFRMIGVGPGATLHHQLRARRRARSMSLDDAALKASLSRNTVASLERGGGSVRSLQRLLSVLAPKARRAAQERSYWGQGDKTDRDSRFTPSGFMEHIYEAFGEVDIDPCSHRLSPVRARRRIFVDEGNGLVDDWEGPLAFVNPPFSELTRWLERAHHEWAAGRVETVVCLVPVRTDSVLFHDQLSAVADMYFLRGRVPFLNLEGGSQPTPFSMMVLAFGTTLEQRDRFKELRAGFWVARDASIRSDDDSRMQAASIKPTFLSARTSRQTTS